MQPHERFLTLVIRRSDNGGAEVSSVRAGPLPESEGGMTDDLERAREAGRRWAAEHPLSDQQQQRLRALLAEPEAS